MVPGSQRPVSRARRWLVAFIAAMSVLPLASAGAASLGGLTSRTLKGYQFAAVNVAPTVLACDRFSLNSTNNQSLNNRLVQAPAQCGTAQWKIDAGSWRINQGLADPGNGFALASIPVGVSNMSTQSTVINASGGNRIGGVTVSVSNNGSTYLVGTISAPGTVQVRIVNNSVSTTLQSASVAIGANSTLRLTRNGTTVTLKVDNTIAITRTLTTTQANLLTGTRAGMFWDAGNPVRFQDFLVTTPSP